MFMRALFILASTFSLIGGALAQSPSFVKEMDGRISVTLSQTGAQECYLDEDTLWRSTTQSVTDACDVSIIPNNEARARYNVYVHWGFAENTMSNSEVNVCMGVVGVDVGFPTWARDHFNDPTYGDKTVYVSLASNEMSLLHQMDNASRSIAYDGVRNLTNVVAHQACD